MDYQGDAQYANSRLAETYVRMAQSNKLVYVRQVWENNNGELLVDLLHTGNKAEETVGIDMLNVDPIPMGFYNLKRLAFFMERVPKRRCWRQGFRKNNTNVTVRGKSTYMPNMFTKSAADALYKMGIRDYPKFKDCVDLVFNEQVEGIAFDEAFAIGHNIDPDYIRKGTAMPIWYKKKTVGTVQADGEVELLPQFGYLQERLEEAQHG